MRLYKTNFIDDSAEAGRQEQAAWSGTQADAGKDRKRLKSEGMRSIDTEEVDVPTSKQELLGFLSQWCSVR